MNTDDVYFYNHIKTHGCVIQQNTSLSLSNRLPPFRSAPFFRLFVSVPVVCDAILPWRLFRLAHSMGKQYYYLVCFPFFGPELIWWRQVSVYSTFCYVIKFIFWIPKGARKCMSKGHLVGICRWNFMVKSSLRLYILFLVHCRRDWEMALGQVGRVWNLN